MRKRVDIAVRRRDGRLQVLVLGEGALDLVAVLVDQIVERLQDALLAVRDLLGLREVAGEEDGRIIAARHDQLLLVRGIRARRRVEFEFDVQLALERLRDVVGVNVLDARGYADVSVQRDGLAAAFPVALPGIPVAVRRSAASPCRCCCMRSGSGPSPESNRAISRFPFLFSRQTPPWSYHGNPCSLSFERADHDALHEVLLHERIDGEHRQRQPRRSAKA